MNRNQAVAGTLLQMTMKSCIKSRESLSSRRERLGILCFSENYVSKGSKDCVCTVLKLQVTLALHAKRTRDHRAVFIIIKSRYSGQAPFNIMG